MDISFLFFIFISISYWKVFQFSSIDVDLMANIDMLKILSEMKKIKDSEFEGSNLPIFESNANIIGHRGCEDLGGNDECMKKGKQWTCVNKPSLEQKFICACNPGYLYISSDDTCSEYLGCDYRGGREKCKEKGNNWLCSNNETHISQYECFCYTNCTDGCRDMGGNKECAAKGLNWRCIDDSSTTKMFKCICQSGYVELENRCYEKRGCKYLGGNKECASKGPHWECVEDNTTYEKFRCRCQLGYKEENGKCREINGCKELGGDAVCAHNGKNWECFNDPTLEKGYICVCRPGYWYYNELHRCIDETCRYYYNKVCRLKGEGWTCKGDYKKEDFRCECDLYYELSSDGNQCTKNYCKASSGYEQCAAKGEHWICVNNYTQTEKFNCVCDFGFIEVNGSCIVMNKCNSSSNTPICPTESTDCVPFLDDYFCKCKYGYQLPEGVIAEYNKQSCLIMKKCNSSPNRPICPTESTVCVPIFDDYFCKCKYGYQLPEGVIEEYNKLPCLKSLETNNSTFVILCTLAGLLLLVAILLIIVFRKFTRKLNKK